MVKTSIVILIVLTVLITMLLGWREQRMTAGRPQPRLGWFKRQKIRINRIFAAAAIASVGTMVILGGIHWLRVAQG
jgi:nitric oxide reductase large subunit